MVKYLSSLLLLLLYCLGYSTKGFVPPHLKTIYIARVENMTTKPLLGDKLEKELINSFIRDGTFRVINDVNANLYLEAKITRYSKSPLEFDATQTVYQWRIDIASSIECKDQVKNEIYYRGSITLSENLPRGTSEEEKIDEILKRVAEQVVTNVLTAW